MKNLQFLRSPGFWVSLVVAVLLLAIPYVVTTTYYIFILITIFMGTAMAASWNLCAGYTGIVPFGNIAFFGIGAYTVGILWLRLGVPPLVGVILGGLTAVVFALAVGYPCLRLRGAYFAIATLGLMEATNVIAGNWRGLTGGALGLSLPVRDPSITPHYYGLLILALAAILTTLWISRSKFGLGLLAIREDQDAAEMSGVNTTWYKIAIFVINGFFTGVAGGFWAYYLPYIDHTILFSHEENIMLIVMAMFGGMGTVLGPFVGATAIVVINQILTVYLPSLVPAQLSRLASYLPVIMYGLLLILMVLFMRSGLMGLFTSLARKVSGSRREERHAVASG